jgi:hypothetical protein
MRDIRKVKLKVRGNNLRKFFVTLPLSTKTAWWMTWHLDCKSQDERIRHPTKLEWKIFDKRNNLFALEARNVRLGLARDGFNTFKSMYPSYYIWPMVMFTYNLPPWLCMRSSFMMLTLLILGPKQLGNAIDVYLQPLIDELKQLWFIGMKMYDAEKKEFYNMHAALLWTINDFPTYTNLSGWSTKGKLACPIYMEDTHHL